MTITDLLYGLETSGLLMLFIAAKLLYDSACVWLCRLRTGDRPLCLPELHLQVGIACWGISLGWLMLLAMVRRDITMSGGDVSWFLDAWPYAALKAIAAFGTIEVVAGITLDDHGHKVWIATALASLMFLLWPEPGRWLSWGLLHGYALVR